ncbi:unnamed protein product [Sphenostylis stenocarpa]|uniref:Cation/H+ exchanger domain-containing protein n=1 Tax=Sphenostylis stenocarpa TaxID=92480 RepID=A0AA86VRZ8_9FABA|nr:unnamed protein product [Sphenostylis stenocarpa]
MGTNETLVSIRTTIFSGVVFDDHNSDPDRRFVFYNVKIDMPPKIVSDGIWGNTNYGALPEKATLPLLELQILAIFIITQCFHLVFKRLGIPYFVSQMMNAVKMDFSMITRTGKKAWTIALFSLMTPTIIGMFLCYSFMEHWQKALGDFDGGRLPVVVMSQTGCSFAVIASLLSDLEILNSELGRLALSSALVMDVLGSAVTGLGTAVVSSLRTDSHDHSEGKGPKLAMFTATKYVLFLTIVIVIGRPAMRWIVRNTPEGRPVKKAYTYVVVLMTFFAGLFGVWAHQSVLGGVVLFGLVVPEGPPLGSELIKQLELFNTWFLLPIFITCCAMKIDISAHINSQLIFAVVTIIVVVHLVKMLLTIGICSCCNMPKTDGLCLALMLSCKGVVDYVTSVFLFDSMLMSNEAVSIIAISILVLGSTARIGVKVLLDPTRKYAGYQKRNILNMKPNAELRVVACIHKPSHIMSIKNALDFCCPTTNNPLVAHVLHLKELVGRSSPIFISHRVQERVDSNYNYSEDVIVAFDLFEHDKAGTALVNTYTAISPFRFMHDDICYLALDKLASIIILPFHVRWGEDGSIESTDKNIRTLNAKVLQRAPCSVGILVKRGSSSSTIYNNSITHSMKRIAIIFLGGSDDREALSFAKRTIKDCSFKLVVYHLVSSNSVANWDLMLDDEVLKGVNGYYGSIENVSYENITIDEPCETSAFVSSIADQHDFFVVGRRNGIKSPLTTALESWTEFSELGVIGDLLAALDSTSNASILVIQQQQMSKSNSLRNTDLYTL